MPYKSVLLVPWDAEAICFPLKLQGFQYLKVGMKSFWEDSGVTLWSFLPPKSLQHTDTEDSQCTGDSIVNIFASKNPGWSWELVIAFKPLSNMLNQLLKSHQGQYIHGNIMPFFICKVPCFFFKKLCLKAVKRSFFLRSVTKWQPGGSTEQMQMSRRSIPRRRPQNGNEWFFSPEKSGFLVF